MKIRPTTISLLCFLMCTSNAMDTDNTAMDNENTVMDTTMDQPDEAVVSEDTAASDVVDPGPADTSVPETPVEEEAESSGSSTVDDGGHWCQFETEYITEKNVSSVENKTLQYQDCEEATSNDWEILQQTTVQDIVSCTVIK